MMSGSEIVYDKHSNEFKIDTHIKAYPMSDYEEVEISKDQFDNYLKMTGVPVRRKYDDDLGKYRYFKYVEYGRRLGNCEYDEDIWKIQIPSLNYSEKNEKGWTVPPMSIYYTPVPEDDIHLDTTNIEFPKKEDYYSAAVNDNLYKYDNFDQCDFGSWGTVK